MKKTITFLGVLSLLMICAFPVDSTGKTPDPYAVSAEQNTVTVKGKVVDKAGAPIAGASVIETGTTSLTAKETSLSLSGKVRLLKQVSSVTSARHLWLPEAA